MYKIKNNQDIRQSLIWQPIVEWSHKKYRYRTFEADEKISARPKILYLVHQGMVRLMGHYKLSVVSNSEGENNPSDRPEASCLGFVGKGQPFELLNESTCDINAYAHTDQTSVLWMYWHELDNWPNFRQEILKAFRYQQQRKMLEIATLSQHRTIDRLYGFLTLLIQEHGIAYIKESQSNQGHGCYLPWTMTDAEIASAIASSRFTVNRLMGELREQGLIDIYRNNYICLPPSNYPVYRK